MPENDKLLSILQRIAALPEPERNALVENIGHTVRDNTRVAVSPGDVGFIPNSEDRNPDRDARLDDGIMGFMPVVGDVLQAGQAVKDASEGKWGRAALGAGLLLAPNLVEKPIKEAAKYVIKKFPGYQLKMLLSGNPLEKQISKAGTVNVNNVRQLASKGSKVEKAVIDKVLASEEFAGLKNIDYNDFRKAVQDELITYKRTPVEEWKDYGMDRLGIFNRYNNSEEHQRFLDVMAERGYVFDTDNEAWVDSIGNFISPSEIDDISKMANGLTRINSYTFSSPRIPDGSAKHYGPNTLGHSRTYTTADEPDVLHVMESQSDWAQEGKVAKNAAYVKDRMAKHPGTESDPDSWLSYAKGKIEIREKEIESLKEMLKTGISENGEKLEPYAIKQIKEELLPAAEKRLAEAKSRFYGPTPQEIYLSDNYTSRQLQENLRFAAERGQTKMRYPTRETAAKIEGYSAREAYFDASGKDITTSGQRVYGYDDETLARIDALKKEGADLFDLEDKINLQTQGIENDLDPRLKALVDTQYDEYQLGRARDYGDESHDLEAWARDIERRKADYLDKYGKAMDYGEIDDIGTRARNIQAEIRELEQNGAKLLPGITKKTVYDYEDILKRYSDFPKQYQKLFKGSEVRNVVDPKGNTWYEVDVPKDYLNMEWPYANGGPLLLNPYAGGGPLGDGFPDFMTRNDDTRSYNTGVKAKGLKDRALRKELKEWESGPGAQLIRDSSLVKYINPRDLSISYIPEEIVPKEESNRTYSGGPAHIDMFTGLDKDSDEFTSRLIYVGVDGETGAYVYLDPVTGLEELYENYIENASNEENQYSSGGKIRIKPSKRGTFTAAAKKHGKSVQAFASQVLANKENYSPAMVKKANFARNAAKWHAEGGSLDNTIDYTGIATTNHRKYNPDYISYIDTSLANADISPAKRASILANIIEESGGNPFALDDTGKFYGLLQWADDRYKVTGEKDPYKEIDNQVNHILSTLGNTTDKVSWTHGGTGSGYNSYKDAMTDFDSDDLATAMKGFTLGYVRPTGKMDSYNNRLKVAEQLLQRYNSTPLQKVTNLAARINKAYGGDMDAILRLIGSAKGGIR